MFFEEFYNYGQVTPTFLMLFLDLIFNGKIAHTAALEKKYSFETVKIYTNRNVLLFTCYKKFLMENIRRNIFI